MNDFEISVLQKQSLVFHDPYVESESGPLNSRAPLWNNEECVVPYPPLAYNA